MLNKQLIYLTGSGRSGSTLLDMMLDGHSCISALGEVHRLYLNAHKSNLAHKCTCGESLNECPRWQAVARALSDLLSIPKEDVFKQLLTTDPRYLQIPDDESGLNIHEPVPERLYAAAPAKLAAMLGSPKLLRILSAISSEVAMHRNILRDSLTLYEAVRQTFQTPLIVDSTKTPVRLSGLAAHSPDKFKVIYLLRDGRGVTAARMKRQSVSMAQAARIWKSEHRKIRFALRRIPDGDVIRIRYEDVCTNPEQELTSLCKFLNVEFESGMLNFRSPIRHSLGGNPMRWRLRESEIKLNENWRDSLSKVDLQEFERIGGEWNARLGYGS